MKTSSQLSEPVPGQVIVLIGDHPTEIRKTPDVCGGDACVRTTRIPVWAIECYRRDGLNAKEIVAAFPSLTEADVELAWKYVGQNSDEIKLAIESNSLGEI